MRTSEGAGAGAGGIRQKLVRRPLVARASDLARAAVRQAKVEVDARRAPRAADDREPELRFTRLYRDHDDPWSSRASDYEQRKYDLTIAVLPKRRYRSAYDPACGTGELSARLAPRCDHLVSADVSADAVDHVRRRLAGVDGVEVERHNLPDDFPSGPFDLVLISEFGYYLPKSDLEQVLDRAAASLEPGGHLLAVHGRGSTPDIYQPGDVVHRRIFRRPGLRHVAGYREQAFRIDLFERR